MLFISSHNFSDWNAFYCISELFSDWNAFYGFSELFLLQCFLFRFSTFPPEMSFFILSPLFLTEILTIFSSTYWTEMLYFLFPNLPNDKFFFLFKAFPTKMFILLSLNFSNWNAFYFFAKLFFRYQNAVEVFFPSPSFIPWLPLLGLGILSAASLRCLFPLSASSLSLCLPSCQ